MHRVVIVIPIYREKLKVSEQISLERAKEILGNYDIVYIAPERLRSYLKKDDLKSEYWPNQCFESIVAYSKLLLTEEFYQRFCNYEYILIYQLDAFVFSDKLQDFCNMGYDYIGAPMPPYWSSWANIRMRVGNGGFSLRKIESCRRVIALKNMIYAQTGRGYEFEPSEDKFFGYCGSNKEIQFFIPDTDTAIQFSIEFNVKDFWRKLSFEHLPFGCHAWSKPQYFDFWRKYIEYFAGDLSAVADEIQERNTCLYQKIRRKKLEQYLLHRLYRSHEKSETKILSENYL